MLTSKQRASLRGLANTLETSVLIGQNGLTESVLNQLNMSLDGAELIKIGLLQNCDLSAKEIINELAQVLGAEPVQAIGRKIVLYRYSRKLKKHIEF